MEEKALSLEVEAVLPKLSVRLKPPPAAVVRASPECLRIRDVRSGD